MVTRPGLEPQQLIRSQTQNCLSCILCLCCSKNPICGVSVSIDYIIYIVSMVFATKLQHERMRDYTLVGVGIYKISIQR